MTSPAPFSPEEYERLARWLSAVARKWRGFDEPWEAGTGLLRHDVDYDPTLAAELARLNEKAGLAGTFFIMLDSPFYNAFSPESREAIRAIAGMGQRVGLHYYHDGPGVLDIAKLSREFEALKYLAGSAAPVVAWHNPPEGFGELNEAARKAGFASAYDPRICAPDRYVSDSNARNGAESIAGFVKRCKAPTAQVLLHPIIWMVGGNNMMDVLSKYTEMREKHLQSLLYEMNSTWHDYHKARRLLYPKTINPFELDKARVKQVLSIINKDTGLNWNMENLTRPVFGKERVSVGIFDGDGELKAAAINSISENALYIHAFSVEPRLRNVGIGGYLLGSIKKLARENGLSAIRLRVQVQNMRAVEFYLSKDFRIQGFDQDALEYSLQAPLK